MREILFIIILFFCCHLLVAQDDGGFGFSRKKKNEYTTNFQSANWGNIHKKGGNVLANIIIAQDEDQFYTWSGYDGYYYESKPILRAFRHNGNQVYSIEIEDEYVRFIHFDNQLLFVSKSESESGEIIINIQKISKRDGTFGAKKQLFSSEKVTRTDFDPKTFNYTISKDNKHLVVTLLEKEISGNAADAPNNVSIISLDTKLNISWQREDYELSTGQSFHLLSMVVGNDGTLFLGTQIFDKATDIFEGHTIKLFILDLQGKRIREQNLEYWGLTIVDLVLKIDRGRVLATGLYNGTANYSTVKGVLLLEIDSYHNEYKRLYSDDIPLEIIGEFIEKRKVEPLKELRQVYLNNVLLSDDGAITLCIQEGNRTPLYGRYPLTRLLTIDDSSPEPHSYGNLLVIKLSSTGRMMFTKVIKTKLTTSFTQQRMGAYSAFNFNGDTYLFYYKGRFPSRSNPIIKTKISDRGTITSEKFLKSSQPKLFICPRFFSQSVKNGSLILYAQMTTKFRFGNLQIK